MDWAQLGGWLATAGTAAGFVITGWLKKRKELADMKVSRAEGEAAISRAEASSAVFELVKNQLSDVTARLTAAEARIDQLREQVADRDNKIHALEMHIRDLEHTMRQHGIEPPARP